MCKFKLIEESSQELINSLDLYDILKTMARPSGVRWYGDVLRRALAPKIMRKKHIKDILNRLG